MERAATPRRAARLDRAADLDHKPGDSNEEEGGRERRGGKGSERWRHAADTLCTKVRTLTREDYTEIKDKRMLNQAREETVEGDIPRQ